MRLSDFIDPYVGSIGHLLTATEPISALPHGMSRIMPVFTAGMKDFYLADAINGFSVGAVTLMPENVSGGYSSRFDHDLEKCRAYGYSAWLEDCLCTVTYAPTEQGGVMRFVFDNDGEHTIKLTGSDIAIVDGAIYAKGEYMRGNGYFSGHMSVAFDMLPCEDGAVLHFSGRTTEIAYAISFIGCESAEENYVRGVKGKSLGEVRDNARNAWDALLGKFAVTGDDRRKKIFYTGLYRVFLRQVCISENGRYFGYDGAVHDDSGKGFYINDGVWDTHRGAHPLQALIEPARYGDILESFIRQYEQSGWLHDFPFAGGGTPCMLGSHTTTLFANAMAHGIDFDAVRAWKAVRYAHFEGSLLPWYIGPETSYDRCYREKGYCPALRPDQEEHLPQVHSFERRQAVAVTLEQAYDDYAAAKLADKVGAEEDKQTLLKRAGNYRNLFDESIGFMAPRDEDGEFIKPYDPMMASAQGGRDYFAECNGWVYTMEVRHDVAGLIELFGGKDKFEKRMDDLFRTTPDIAVYHWLSKFPDSTGLIGQFCMGNEPAFHIPYMYLFCGKPWKTQKILHDICRVWFSPHPLGICGDEDGGAMSAWYVFTAMGFYPFCPGSGVYLIGSPQFDKIEMQLGNGKTFTVLAEGANTGRKYIASATLNGKPLNRSWFTADELLAGGVLELTMSDKPCRDWAVADDSVPPSMY